MSKKLHLILFIIIFFLGIGLRFYQLGNVPGSLEWDEASIGYNAYSILETARDEYGEFLPTTFKAFGEYKQPVYIYLDVLSIAVFGLNDFAVRFPSALFGILSIVFVYFLVNELFRKEKNSKIFALLSMFFFAISPWSIQFSRAAFEANVALSFIIAGAWLFLKGIHQKKQLYCFLAIGLFVLSTYTYISAKVFAPILVIALLGYGWHYFKNKKIVATTLLVVFIILSMLWVFDARSVSRSQGVIFTNQQEQLLQKSIAQMDYDVSQNDVIGKVLHNRRFVYANALVENYLSHFNPIWLFFTGDEVNRHHAPDYGNLHLISFPFILLGLYILLKKYFSRTWILFVWLLAAPIASSLTFEAPHSLRSLMFLPTWHIFAAIGVATAVMAIQNNNIRRMFIGIVGILYGVTLIYYTHQYFVHTGTDFQAEWQYGYKEAILESSKIAQKEQRIIYSQNFEQPYIFYLYYLKYDPVKYIAGGSSHRKNGPCFNIDNAYFGDCKDKLRTNDIYVALEDTSAPPSTELKRYNYHNGDPVIRINRY